MTTPTRQIADRVWDHLVDVGPWFRVRRGLPVERIPSGSEAEVHQEAAYARGVLAQLAAETQVDEDDRLTAGYLTHAMGGFISTSEHISHGFTVTPYMQLMQTMVFHQVLQAFTGEATPYLSLVADQREVVREWQRRIERQREEGILIPAPALAGVRESLRRGRQSTLAAVEGFAPSGAADAAVSRELGTAFEDLLAVFDEAYESDAPAGVGWGQWAGGEDHYRSMVRRRTSSSMSPEEIHSVGLAQVAELTERMAELRSRMGFTGTELQLHEQLATDPRVHASDPAEVDALFLRHMAALEPLIGDWFAVLPQAPYGVERLDPAQEAGMTYGYYELPTPAVPVGRYRWNGGDLASKSLLTYAALIFHELAPGHHFHLARQSENLDLPDLRREGLEMECFNEGWAEYASGLGWEMGLYDDPLDAYGRLVHERFTAQRLVVDTGLNLLGWTLEQGAAYAKAHTTDSEAQIASEVLRYSTDLPAQALAYRLGYLELTRLRSRAETALGDRFDVRAFHEQVLGPGALPFPALEGHLDRWTGTTLSNPARG